jgi:hypothetical protein
MLLILVSSVRGAIAKSDIKFGNRIVNNMQLATGLSTVLQQKTSADRMDL